MVFVLASAQVHAQDDKVARGPIPEWVRASELMDVPDDAGGLVFVRRQDTLIHLDEQGQAQFFGFRTKILHPNALPLGNLSITWNPASGAPVVHAIKVYRGDETFDVLENASFEILRREDLLEASMLTGNLTAVLNVEDLRVGDELEFSVTTRLDDPTLGINDSGFLFLAADPPAGRFHLGLSWEEGQKPTVQMTDDMSVAAQESAEEFDFRFDNPPIITPPKDAPARYQWHRTVEYSDFDTWADVSRHFAPLFAKAAMLEETSPLKAEAKRIAAAFASPSDRAAAALKLVQENVRYIYVGLDGGNFTPASADTTWQRRFGDCKGKTALLLALLDELSIKAEAVLASNGGIDDGLDERLPNPRMFDHVLVRAHIDGQILYMDGTLPSVARPNSTPVYPYRWILPIDDQGSPLESLPWQMARRPDEVFTYEIDARAGFDQPATITSTNIVRGLKGLQQQVQFSGLTPSQMLTSLRQTLTGESWQSIEAVDWHYDERAEASIMTITGTGAVDWEDEGDGERSLVLPGGGFNPPAKKLRPASQDQSLPYFNKPEYSCYVTTVRLPEPARAEKWTSSGAFDTHIFGKNYYRAFELRDGAVRMIRGFRVVQDEISAATAQRDNARIPGFNNSKAWIRYDPSRETQGPFGSVDVPATYDIDWAADDVPCLAKAAK